MKAHRPDSKFASGTSTAMAMISLCLLAALPASLAQDDAKLLRFPDVHGDTVVFVHQEDIFPGAGSQTGTGDTVQSLFFSPKAATASGWIWGAGPVLLLPTGETIPEDLEGRMAHARTLVERAEAAGRLRLSGF